jgi:hypothetical protein
MCLLEKKVTLGGIWVVRVKNETGMNAWMPMGASPNWFFYFGIEGEQGRDKDVWELLNIDGPLFLTSRCLTSRLTF